MSTVAIIQGHDERASAASDGSAFAELAERYRRGLQAHCYRMLGSYEDAEDLTQEALLRAWRGRDGFAGRSSFGAWVYRIATNACLSALDRRRRSSTACGPAVDSIPERPPAPGDGWPDAELLPEAAAEPAVLVALRELPSRQRAVVFLRDVCGWSAKDAAELLETSVASVNSALQRGRATLRTQLDVKGVVQR
jgi:RNA polymerase sigma-70 factor, ECF subfamily